MEQKVGSIIKQVLLDTGMTKAEFARRLNTSNQNVHGIFRRSNFDTELLQKIGKILNHDFFQYYQDKTEEKPKKLIDKLNNVNKTKILIELEFEEDHLLNKMLKEKVLQILK
jgi:transcriptional regulator with XRE-family HTH domain